MSSSASMRPASAPPPSNKVSAEPLVAGIPFDAGLPFVGHIPDFKRNPIGLLDRLWKRHGDIYAMKIGPRMMYVVSHPEMAQQILVEGKHVFQRPTNVQGGTILTPILGKSVLTTDGESWLLKRRMMQPIFHRQSIQTMGDKMTSAGEAMLGRWAAKPAGQAVNLGEEMKLVTLDIINRTMFSVDVLPAVDRVGATIDVALHYLMRYIQSPIRLPDSWPTPAKRRFDTAKATLDDFLYAIIAERRVHQGEPHGDLLDMLLAARDQDTGEGMNDEQVRNEIATIYGAGHETTALALTWTWYALNQNPDVLRKLQAEVDTALEGRAPTMADLPKLPYTLQVFEESMRLFPPVPFTGRVTHQATTLGGYDLPQGAFVNVAINNIHRHPGFWDAPEAFRPERFAPENKAMLNRTAYIPFLTGPHMCIGNNFALMEGQLLLAQMAQHYNVRVVPDQTLTKEVAITMRPKEGLLVTLQPRS